MPTPVSVARQCLTEESARALNEAVSVARRRSHAQTTSLHALSALLSMTPASPLRDVCVRAAAAYSRRLQFRALELCVGVSLDRLPSSKTPADEPPVSNSLMAAIKRSQANQRRHPETYHLQQLHNNNGNNSNNQTTSVLKVELKHFIISILDDPIVSRVFGDAGFRSCDIKVSVLHPPLMQQFPHRYFTTTTTTRCPPLFLCNLTTDSDYPDPGRAFGSVSGYDDENCRRIGEVMMMMGGREKRKNPLLFGVCANDVLRRFVDLLKRGKTDFLPVEIGGLSVFSLEKEMMNNFHCDDGLNKVDDEIRKMGEKRSGLIVNLGDLKVLLAAGGGDDYDDDGLRHLVTKMTELLKVHVGKMWVIGCVSENETFSKVLDRFPTLEKDWDLHLLPVTPSSPSSCQGLYPKSSLMGSFVPFGGFFSSPSDFKSSFSGMNKFVPRCHLCNEKYEQEVAALVKAGSTFSVADQYSEKLPSWLRTAEADLDKGIDIKAKDDGIALSSRIMCLQKKWNDICQRLHQIPAFPKLDINPSRPNFQIAESVRFSADGIRESRSLRMSPGMNVGVPDMFPIKQKPPMPLASLSDNVNFQSGLSLEVSKSPRKEDRSGFPSNTTSSSVSSVATDLGLGTLYASNSQEPNTPKSSLDQRERLQIYSGSSSCSAPAPDDQFNPANFKSLKEFLSMKVGWQNEAVNTISEIVSRCRAGYGRSRGTLSSSKGIWLTFLGPDKIGKKKIAQALADIIFGSQQTLTSVDFSAPESYDDRFRGKTVVDYVAGEIAKKPHSVIFLENVDKAELPDQNSLSEAVSTGKLRDSHGREISTSNMIFVTTSSTVKDNKHVGSGKRPVKFTEERVLGAKSWKMQLQVSKVSAETSNQPFPRKRKLTESEQAATMDKEKRPNKSLRSFLDLNIPVEESEENIDSLESDSVSENTEAWLEDFFEKVDGNAVFKPFDFDGLAQKIERDIRSHFHHTFGSDKSQIEIDEEVIVQILAAARLSDKESLVDHWLQNVVSTSFVETRQKLGPAAQFLVRLVACRGCPVEEGAPGIVLPVRIDVP